jgi:hypothetical protein
VISRTVRALRYGNEKPDPELRWLLRFYFDVSVCERLVADDDGIQLPDLSAARNEAARSLTELAKEALSVAVLASWRS